MNPQGKGQHPLVVERISELQLYHNKVTFPGEVPNPPLTPVDYQQFLLLVNEKFKNTLLKRHFDEMVISCYDNAAIEGLIAYNETTLRVPFQTLTLNLDNLDLSNEKVRERFLFNLKTLLLTMSDSNLSAFKFIDNKNQFTPEIAKNVVDFIAASPVAIDINLPTAFQDTSLQKTIDEVISDTIRQKNIAALGKTVTSGKDDPVISNVIRTRPALRGKQSLSIDIELQQEQQVEVTVEAVADKKDGTEKPEPGTPERYTISDFALALSHGELDSSAKSQLVNSQMASAVALWLNWTGALTVTEATLPSTCIKLSKTACEELLRYNDTFQFGLDLKNLPAGFLLQKDGAVSCIHFDDNFKLLAEYNPLQVQTTESPNEKPLPHSLFNQWFASADGQSPIKMAWTRLNTANYNKEAHQAFKQFLPQMLLLSEATLVHLFTACFDQHNHFNSKQFRFLLENAAPLKTILAVNPGDTNIDKRLTDLFAGQKAPALVFIHHYAETMPALAAHLLNSLIGDNDELRDKIALLTDTIPDINLNALLQLYAHLGESGIDALMKRVDANIALFKHLNTLVFAKTKTYAPLLSGDYQDAINAIQGFGADENLWWDTLLRQHCNVQSNVHLVDLVNAFKAFKEQLNTLPTHDHQPLTFPPTCDVTGVKSLPVALSRMLTLLQHCNEQNRHEQWHDMSTLDLSSRGMIKPASILGDKEWAFITPEMRINAEHETKGDLFAALTNYNAPSNWKTISYQTPAELHENFFRYVAYQEKRGQLPLELYRYVHDELNKRPLSANVKRYLYPLIAASTTQPSNVAFITSTKAAKEDVTNLIELIIKTPVSAMFPAIQEQYRNEVLMTLIVLKDIPPLPVLSRLVSLVSSSLTGLANVMRNLPRLKEANADLRRQVTIYGPCIYDGMKDYLPDDYHHSELFFNHMHLVNKIADALDPFNYIEDARLLMRMISSFRLTLKNIDTMLDTYFNNRDSAYQQRRNEALQLLCQLSVRNNPSLRTLDESDLRSILQTVRDTPKPVVNILKELTLKGGQALGAYFPDDLLDNYGNDGISKDVARSIAENFNEKQQQQMSKILLRFSANGDSLHYSGLVDKIITITKPLSTLEKTIFITKLTTSLGLYTDKQPLFLGESYFVKLLDTLITNNTPNELLNLIAAERHLFIKCSKRAQVGAFFVKTPENEYVIGQLSQKAVLYLRTILPAIKAIDHLAISQLELTPRLHDVLLKTPIAQLTAVSNVISDQKDIFDRQEATLATILDDIAKGNQLDFNSAKESTDTFIEQADLADKSLFKQFRDTCEEMDKAKKDLNDITAFKTQTLILQQTLSDEKTALNSYPTVFITLYKKINAIAEAYPSSKKEFLEIYDRYLDHYSPLSHGELLTYLTHFVTALEKSFAKTADKNNVLSLCLQFNSDTDDELQPERLLELLKAVDTVPKKHRETVLNIAVALINNQKDYTLEGFKGLCKLTRENPALANTLANMYKKAPFPTIAKIQEWHSNATSNGNDYAATMGELYEAYNKAPCSRESSNGFHVHKAKKQLAQFQGFDASCIDLNAFKAKTDEMRDKTSNALLEMLTKYNPNRPTYDASFADDYETLVAVAAELFHRSKGNDKKDSNGKPIPGSSMEINTTQYLAILSSLKTPGHVTSQIGTGEGKSRIMMISIACQHAQGKTIDFVTSNAQLATRDFVEYQAYFDMIDAKTIIILAHTDPSLYKIGGINFSDPSNLSLFRNKGRSLGQSERILDPVATNRALLLDEADKTYFDVADTRFNFSKEGIEPIRGMAWVYPLLMAYFAQKKIKLATSFNGKTVISPMDLYYENIDLSRETFLLFASSKCPTSDLMRLKALSNAQIEQWQVSAVTASQLTFKEDFIIEADVLISTPDGPNISSEAQLLFANRVSKSAKFSFGVHQCLHARLNLARNNLDAVPDITLRAALSQCEQAFYVPDEKQIVYSSTSKNLLDDYAEGTLKAVTGTSGSLIERQEARELYGLNTNDATSKMHFIDVPRDRGIHRTDRAIRLTENERQQINALVEQIKEARNKNQPILVIAENDKESTFLFKKLSQLIKNDKKIQLIHSQLSHQDEKALIDIAGLPGQITVSTDMIGRGTDISLKGTATTHGLHVMVTYLPRPRDLAQIIGRSGRFGAQGEASLILDKNRLKKALGKSTLTDGFYRNTEAYIAREQALMDRKKQCERIIKNTVGDVRKALTDSFFEGLLKQTDKKDIKKLLPIWTVFFDKSDKAWTETWPPIQKELRADPIDVDQIECLFIEYTNNVQKLWDTLRRNTQDADVVCVNGKRPIDTLVVKVPHLTLGTTTKKLLADFNIGKYSMDNWTLYHRYDIGHEGRAVKYSHWSIPVIASLKGYANLLPFVHFSNAKRPFATVRAWLEGHGQLFPEFRASKRKSNIIGAVLFGVLGAAAGAALMATGVLAPLGLTLWGLGSLVTSTIISGAIGLTAGAIVGLACAAIVDAFNHAKRSRRSSTTIASSKNNKRNDSYARMHDSGIVNFHHYSEEMDHEEKKDVFGQKLAVDSRLKQHKNVANDPPVVDVPHNAPLAHIPQ